MCREGQRCVLLTDEHLNQVVQLGQQSVEAGKPLRIRIERVGVALTESMQSVPRSSQKKRLLPKGAQSAGLGGLPTYTNRKGERVVMHQSVQSVANNVNSNLAAWTSLRPGTDAWLNWQRNVKKTLTDTPELQEHAKYIVPPRAQKGDHAYILLPSAGCFYHFPFVSDGRRYALLGRPRCVSGTAEQQVPPELLEIMKKLAPEVCTPENELAARRRQEEKDKNRAEYMAKVSSTGPGQAQSKEEILERRKELMAKEQERQEKDWCTQVQAMRSHTSFSTLLPGGPMLAAMDVTLLVVDDAQCLLASRQRLDSPSEQNFKTLTELRALLADITVVSAFDVLATMQLQADNERALARQQALILEIEEENELKTALKSTKQAKNRKKKNRKQQKSPKTGNDPAASTANGTSVANSWPPSSSEGDGDQFHSTNRKVPSESDSTDGTDDGLTQELELAIAIADEEELYATAVANDGWTVVAPPRAKPVASKSLKKNKKQQSRRGNNGSMATTRVVTEAAEIKAAEDMAEKVSPHHDHSQPATPDREAPPRKAAMESPAAPKPSSPASTEQHKTVDIEQMEWPQLASIGVLVGPESPHQELQAPGHDKTGTISQDKEQSAKVAAQQIENMMKGLADEDEAMLDTVSSEPPLQSAGVGGSEIADVPTVFEQDYADGAQLQAAYDKNSHRSVQQPWNVDAPVYDGEAGLADPNQFTEAMFAIPTVPGVQNGLDTAAQPPEGTQTFTVAFTVQGSGTICVNAPTGQDAIEQLQYSTSLQGGLAGLLSYAKCATMFQVIE
jgi:hypothetical protein